MNGIRSSFICNHCCSLQKWLDYYGPFEAVIDGANAGIYNQGRFMPSKVYCQWAWMDKTNKEFNNPFFLLIGFVAGCRSMLLLMVYVRSFLQKNGHSLFCITSESLDARWMDR